MAPSPKCPHCGATCDSAGTAEDDTGQKICGECGAVLEGPAFHSDSWEPGSTFQADHQVTVQDHSTLPQAYLDVAKHTSRGDRQPEGKTRGLEKIKHLLQFMGVQGARLFPECSALFSQIYQVENFKNMRVGHKEMIGACCVYIVCRDQDIPMTVTHIAMLLGCDPHAFWAMLLKIQKELGITYKGLDLEGSVDLVCSLDNLEESKKIVVKKMLPLVREAWITEGRNRECAIRAAYFIVWQSEDVTARANVKYRHFADQVGWGDKKHRVQVTIRLLKEMQAALLKVVSGIPWMISDVSYKMVLYHLTEIIQHQKTIFQSLSEDDRSLVGGQNGLATVAGHGTEESAESCIDPDIDDPVLKAEAQDNDDADNEVCDIMARAVANDDNPALNLARTVDQQQNVSRKRSLLTNADHSSVKVPRQVTSGGSHTSSSSSSSPFLPTSFIRNRNRLMKDPPQDVMLTREQVQQLDCEVSEAELDDDELSQYIRTQEEVDTAKELERYLDAELAFDKVQ